MTRFIQQRIKPLVSRFVPKALCPSCGMGMSVKTTPSAPATKEDSFLSESGNKKKEKKEKKEKKITTD